MKKEFINLNGLKNVLSPKEMKNVTGGSDICPSGYPYIFRCSNGNLVCCSKDCYCECCPSSTN